MKLAAVVVSAVVATAYVGTASTAPPRWAVERYSISETWRSFADIGKKDNGGPGDVYTSQQALEDASGRTVGVVNGFGVNLRKPYVFFHWTASLPSGALTIESTVDLRQRTTTYPIAGGTGRYAGVRGTVTVTDAGNSRSTVVVRFRR